MATHHQYNSSPKTLKRKASALRTPTSHVRFSHVAIRTHAVELWGGGGVPADDGPPLGLSWDVMGPERRVRIEDFEVERETLRTPKEAYCSTGCLEATKRQLMLMSCGSTLKQIRSAKQAVAKLNHQRWQASKMLFEDTWLFSVAAAADETDVLAMAGHYDSRPLRIDAALWSEPAAVVDTLGSIFPSADVLDDAGTAVDWKRLGTVLRDLDEHIVFLVECAGVVDATEPARHLGHLVGSVASALVSRQMEAEGAERSSLCVVLQGWSGPRIRATWSARESDEYVVMPLK